MTAFLLASRSLLRFATHTVRYSLRSNLVLRVAKYSQSTGDNQEVITAEAYRSGPVFPESFNKQEPINFFKRSRNTDIAFCAVFDSLSVGCAFLVAYRYFLYSEWDTESWLFTCGMAMLAAIKFFASRVLLNSSIVRIDYIPEVDQYRAFHRNYFYLTRHFDFSFDKCILYRDLGDSTDPLKLHILRSDGKTFVVIMRREDFTHPDYYGVFFSFVRRAERAYVEHLLSLENEQNPGANDPADKKH